MASSESSITINYKILLLAIAIFIGMVYFLDFSPGHPAVTITAAIAIFMAILWLTEAIPIGLTSLLPLFLFPAFGVLDGKAVSNAYINYVIFLFIGGFFMALALEKWGLHKRMALKILATLGGNPFRILLGFMLASAFLSMWMSNTATAMMMLPIVFSVTEALEESQDDGSGGLGKLPTAMLLGVAYGCSIGGIATLVGTPPNLSFVRIFTIIYPSAPEISFGKWMFFALPLTLAMFAFAIAVLYFMFPPAKGMQALDKSFFNNKYKALGAISAEQKRVFVLFLSLVFLWVFRADLEVGLFTVPGWSAWFPVPKYINDGTIAMFIAALLFVIPSSNKGEGLLTWKIIDKIPWHIVFLFGGGFALAKAVIDSGLASFIGQELAGVGKLSNVSLLFTVTSLMTFLTEFTSNTATTEMMLPVVAGLANEIEVHPLFLMLPITLAASMAFMFPIATPPNAVVFGSGKLRMMDMVKAGFVINLIGISLVVLCTYFVGGFIFDIDPNVLPEWAKNIKLDAKH